MRKKIGLVTILDVANFGTMLQGYALAKKIQDEGCDVEFVNYIRPGHSPLDKFKTFCNDRSLGNSLKRFVLGFAALMSYSMILSRCRKFVTKSFKFSRKYNSIEQLRKNPPHADLFMTGSDQVWNSTYNGGVDKAFFLDFTDEKKTAYAASVGLEAFSENELPEIKRMLSSYDSLSIRESQTVEYFNKIGFNNVEHVLDPTLLLDAEDWKRAVNYKEKAHEPYLLVYSVERFNNDFIFEQARQIAKARNLKMYVVCSTYPVKAKDYGFDKIFAMATVEQFITLMLDADFIVASSFHGTAFSMNFNKEFITISAKKYNIRMESLVQQFNLADRIVVENFCNPNQINLIDYDIINQRLQIEREKSLHFLNNILSGVN